jgi:transposase-like protein
MQPAKRKLTITDKETILGLARKGKGVVAVARELGIHGHIVNGFLSTARRRGLLPPAPKAIPPRPMLPPTQEEQLLALAKSWRKSEPDAEFSVHTGSGQKLYIATYRGGVVLRIGENKKVAILTPGMAMRVSQKIVEMANWSIER